LNNLPTQAAEPTNHAELGRLPADYQRVRSFSETLCQPLETEDFVVQSMADVSPTRWHLAHTTWFFETFVLARWERDYQPANPAFEYLFNSYYNTVGEPFPRPRRGLLTRPTVREVFDYRRAVDERIAALLDWFDPSCDEAHELSGVITLGMHHEQQHQELMLTDIKHVLSCNPLYPAYRSAEQREASASDNPVDLDWIPFDAGLIETGYDGGGFCYDNERPRHRTYVEPFRLANRLVTNREFQAFIDDGGYRRPELWLSLGWTTVQNEQWTAPLYWVQREGAWHQFTLAGLQPLCAEEPVCHVSYFEADAFARWSGALLPTEAQWEHAAERLPVEGHFAGAGHRHPQPAGNGPAGNMQQMYGDLWQWTSSPYSPYPGYQPPAGALGEYNGKFMCNQYVLRGGSCATPRDHIRPSYRNFFPPEARWQFSGIRLCT